MPGPWHGPRRIARSCCRRWPAPIRPTRGAPTGRSRITAPGSRAMSKACASALSAISTSATTKRMPPPATRSTPRRNSSKRSAVRCATSRCRRFPDFGENFRDRMVLGGLVSGADYVQALRRRRELVAELDRAMAGLDIVITAAAPSEAPPIDQVPKFALFERPSLTIPFNLTGSPAMSVCCGYTEAGLPLSFQIVGKRFEDATVLRLAHAYEQATSWRGRRPNL